VEEVIHVSSLKVERSDCLVEWLVQNGVELVKKIKAVYCIKVVQGDKVGTWVIDVKNGIGSVRYDHAGITDTSDDMTPCSFTPLLLLLLLPLQNCRNRSF